MITAYLVGESELMARMSGMYPNAKKGLLEAVTRLAIQLQRNVMKDKLSGQVLNVRTGTLRRSINQLVSQTDTSTEGVVGTNVEYAARFEYGFHGSETVKAHSRTIRKVFGKPIDERVIQVRSFSRQANQPERSFLRSAMRDMESQIKTELENALKQAVKR
jgi:phage gpG-like protein